MSVLIKGMKVPENCGDCPFCIFTADEKRSIGYCNTSDDDYYCKVLDRFMEYDDVDGGVDILGKPNDCPLVEVETADVRENVHGEWVVDEHLLHYAPFHECKKCGEQMYITHDNFCPNCGADMRKEVEE